jgi:hypothetical protein
VRWPLGRGLALVAFLVVAAVCAAGALGLEGLVGLATVGLGGWLLLAAVRKATGRGRKRK